MEAIATNTAAVPEVHCVGEVRLASCMERHAEVLYFYSELLGLPVWPAAEQIPGGYGLGDPRCGLLLQYRHDPPVDPMRRRLTLVVRSLKEFEKRLEEHEWPFRRIRGLSYTDQWIVMNDPLGHIIELRQFQNLL